MVTVPIRPAQADWLDSDCSVSVPFSRPFTWVNLGAGNNWARICRDHFRAYRSSAYHSSSVFIAVDLRESSRSTFLCDLGRAVGLPHGASYDAVAEEFRQFAARHLYLQGDLTSIETYTRLRAVLDRSQATRVFYLGLPGSLTSTVIGHLEATCCRTGDCIVSDKPWWHLRASDAGPRSHRVV